MVCDPFFPAADEMLIGSDVDIAVKPMLGRCSFWFMPLLTGETEKLSGIL